LLILILPAGKLLDAAPYLLRHEIVGVGEDLELVFVLEEHPGAEIAPRASRITPPASAKGRYSSKRANMSTLISKVFQGTFR
jgi:hypothetical protein